jgi:outer membrane protein assembly factor BamB
MCIDSASLADHLEKAKPADLRRRPWYEGTLKRKRTVKELQDSDAVAFVVAKNAVITVLEQQRPRSLSSKWTLAGLDSETGKVIWTKPLKSAVLPGGLLVDRHGRIIVVHEDGSVSCLG